MGFLDGLRGRGLETKSADPAGAIGRATNVVQYIPQNGLLSGASGGTDVDRAVQFSYQKSLWVWRCIDVIATTQANLAWEVHATDDPDSPVVDDPQIRYLFNKNSNSFETAWMFRYRLSTQLLLSTRGAFVEIVPNREGRPAQMILLDPASTRPIPDERTFVSAYEVRRINGQRDLLSPDQVRWIKLKPHPTDAYSQMTPLVAAGLAIDTDYLARVFNRQFLSGDGRPGLLISVQGKIGPETAAEIKSRFSGGPSNAGGTTVIEADGLTVEDMGATPHDAQWMEAVNDSKQSLLLAFGVPESVMGNASGRTFDNADAERENFYMDTMQPHCGPINAAFDGDLVDPYNMTNQMRWSDIDVLQRSKQARADKALANFNAGTITLDEYRLSIGLIPLNDPGSRVVWIMDGKIPVGASADQEAAVALAVSLAPPAAGAAGGQTGFPPGLPASQQVAYATSGKTEETLASLVKAIENIQVKRDEIQDAEVIAEPRPKSILIEHKQVKADPHGAERVYVEAEMSGLLSAWSDHQERAVLERLNSVKARKGTRHWEGEGVGTKALDVDMITDPDRWSAEIRGQMEASVRRNAIKQMTKTLKRMDSEGIIAAANNAGRGNPMSVTAAGKLFGGGDANRADALDQAIDQTLDVISQSAFNQSVRLKNLVSKLDAEGADREQIEAQLKSAVSNRGAWRQNLSTMATTMMFESIPGLALEAAGDVVVKTWQAHDDNRVRLTHHEADGQKVDGDELFTVGMSEMAYPCDPTAPISERANCRCSLDWQLADGVTV